MSGLEVWLVSMLDPLKAIFAVACLVTGTFTFVLGTISVFDPPPKEVLFGILLSFIACVASVSLFLAIPTEAVYLQIREAASVSRECGNE